MPPIPPLPPLFFFCHLLSAESVYSHALFTPEQTFPICGLNGFLRRREMKPIWPSVAQRVLDETRSHDLASPSDWEQRREGSSCRFQSRVYLFARLGMKSITCRVRASPSLPSSSGSIALLLGWDRTQDEAATVRTLLSQNKSFFCLFKAQGKNLLLFISKEQL